VSWGRATSGSPSQWAFEPAQVNKTLIGGFHSYYADVELRQPVGRRIVIDACAGVARSSLAELHGRVHLRPPRHVPPDRTPGGAPPPTYTLIEELKLGSRAYNVLKRAGVQTVEHLTKLSADDVAALPGMSRKAFAEIVDALAAWGRSLR
jgi:Bacterial RNA polymerase, alpha chain C terminal domain